MCVHHSLYVLVRLLDLLLPAGLTGYQAMARPPHGDQFAYYIDQKLRAAGTSTPCTAGSCSCPAEILEIITLKTPSIT